MRRAFSVATFVVLPQPALGYPLGRVLLIKHKKLGLWLPVGGEMEPGETPLEAAQRELREETGLVTGRDAVYPVIKDAYAAEPRNCLRPGQNCTGECDASGKPPGFLGYEEHQAGAKDLHMNFNFVAVAQTREIKGDGSFEGVVWHAIGDLFVSVEGTSENVHYYLRRIAELHQARRL